jgi:D-serine deaminase-like pyridoxal phosphate-dependent protein
MARMLQDMETPALLLDQARMERNIERMRRQVERLGVAFRPHVKTNKSFDVTSRMMTSPQGPITVSTLLEADFFAGCGVRDILYAVCIAPNKIDHVLRLQADGVRMSVLVDSVEAATLLGERLRADPAGGGVGVLIEVDSDGHRSGVRPESEQLLEIARTLQAGGVAVRGVMTHAGSSYDCRSAEALRAMAEQERARIVLAAQRLRAIGIACPVVSVGSTPTALAAEQLEGVTELRAGVFVFFDLCMAGIGVCSLQDIALSVLATVIGHQHEKGWTLLDAGWMAMSRDRGTAAQPVDQGYGLVCDIAGRPLADYILLGANQEHGIMARRPGSPPDGLHLPVGTQLRILPNHACSTAAQYPAYQVIGPDGDLRGTWQRFSGW